VPLYLILFQAKISTDVQFGQHRCSLGCPEHEIWAKRTMPTGNMRLIQPVECFPTVDVPPKRVERVLSPHLELTYSFE
jgi:hypothetical protein